MRNPLRSIQKFVANLGHKRSPLWPSVRRAHLIMEKTCQWCGCDKSLEVHHIKPFHEEPKLELEFYNLITLCEHIGEQCHLEHGHAHNWKKSVPSVREDCEKHKKEMRSWQETYITSARSSGQSLGK